MPEVECSKQGCSKTLSMSDAELRHAMSNRTTVYCLDHVTYPITSTKLEKAIDVIEYAIANIRDHTLNASVLRRLNVVLREIDDG